ncbi:disks large homolog 5 isoform X4 [Engystomops pustulosus]|uniref:disks large homolog 5 isoform X4 n=1 Tax=Engystomops pustulosus TaxID=76066 RepID=UPI003AFADDF4
MEPKHRELLQQCHQNLVESISDPDNLLRLLEQSGTISLRDRQELDSSCSSQQDKVDLLLKMLLLKDKDHFQDLRVALEKSQPHLLPILYLNGLGSGDSAGSTYSVLTTMPSDSESSGSLSSVGKTQDFMDSTANKASSPPLSTTDGRLMSEKLDTILSQLRQVTRERDELRKRLALSSPGSTFDDCRPSPKLSADYERLKVQCMKAMSELEVLQSQHSKALKKCEEAAKEADFYHTLHSRVLSDQTQLQEDSESLRRKHAQLQREFTHLQQSCQDLKRIHEADQKEISELRRQQQLVVKQNGSSELINKLYDTALDKLEVVKKDYDSLRRQYNEKVSSHNLDLGRLEQSEEEKKSLQKQMEGLLKQRDSTLHLQHQYSSSMRRYDSIQQELNKATLQNKELQREIERLQAEATRFKTVQLKAVKDAEKYKEERDSVFNEYRLIMSERDQVIKEMDKMQTELELAQGRLKNTSCEKRVASEEMEALRQELNSALVERDRAIFERNELLEKYCHEVKDKAEAQKELDQACKDIETVKEERDVARKERTEAIIQRDHLLREYYQARQIQDSATLDMERANKEIEVLRKQYEAMTHELKEATQEAEVAKCRRDWAFQERDKIVAERESIRTLCDNLRRERDRAVSELADALRNLDDMRKQKNDATRELKELKEKMDNQIEKEARFRQLMAHSSHDSAIDTDSLEWETEVVEFEREREDMDLKALGFDVADGVSESFFPGDSGLFVTKVDKGSVADGRLRVNDCLLKINDVDLTNKDRKQLIKAVLSGGDVINMVIRRRRSLGSRIVTPVNINLGNQKDSGISLETGVLVASVMPGSPAAKEGSLSVGDRVVAINGITLDNKSITECEALLRSCRETISISLLKVFPPTTSWSGQNLFENLKDSCRILPPNIQAQNKRNLKNNSSTQTDIFCPDLLDHKKDLGDCSGSERALQLSCHSHSEHSLGSIGGDAFMGRGYELLEEESRPLGYNDALTDALVEASTAKRSSGTWPKVMVSPGHSQSEFTVFKRPRQRKSIFDPETFRRPQTPPKLTFMTPGSAMSHSSQSSKVDRPPTPPTPPKRSDSIKFKHRHQSSSASDSTVTAGSPPTSPLPSTHPTSSQEITHKTHHNRGAGKCCREDGGDCSVTGCRGSGEVESCLQRAEEPEVKRARPLSAPASKHRLAPVSIPHHSLQKFSPSSEDRLSPELNHEWVRFSPTRSPRHSDIFASTLYGSGMSGTVPRSLAPCPAVTAVLRNPIYTAWSHRVPSNNCPSSTGQGCSQHMHQSAQHQGRLSLDLSHKHPSEYCDTARPRVPHGSNSLPSSARLGSLSQSECSSPSLASPPHSPLNLETSSFASSQSQNSIASLPRISISTVPMGERRKDSHYYFLPHFSSSRYVFRTRSLLRLPAHSRPRFSSVRCLRPLVDEPRHVKVQKGAEPLGISIGGGESGGIFVSKVMAGSIAQQAGLEYGDQLLEFNGINLRNATEQQARLIIGQQCDTITILAQYNPHMCQPLHSRSSSRLDAGTSHSTPHGSGAATPDNHSVIDTVSEQDEGTMTPPSKETTPSTSPRGSLRTPVENMKKHSEVRTVTLSKSPVELGMQICGGNLHGIYVLDLDEDTVSGGLVGLLTGDLITEYGSVDMRNKTAEEAYLEMLKPTENVKLKLQQKVDEFNKVKEQPGDGFYVRALYDRQAEQPQELSFKKDDILYVDDTLPQGVFGTWMGWQLDENAQKLERGQIPSKYMMEQEFSRRLSVSEVRDEGGAAKTLSAAARRSFFRRKNKHKRSGSRDGKELQGLDTISTDSIPFLDESMSLAYQRVQRVDCTAPRPVLILGPLVDAVKDMLVKESPGKFCRCPLEVMKASQQAIERGVKDCLFIDYKRRSGHFDVTTVASIKEITEKNCHCLLDIAPHAIERLHSVHIYPIVLFIRYKSTKQIKEQKDPIFLRDKVTQKNSKEQFESAQKIEQEYSKYFTAVIQGGALFNICTQILAIVDQEQNKALWIPAGAL